MAVKASEMYQGSDWLTYRWAVAQAFDTLDRIRDLCLHIPVAGASGHATAYDLPAEDIADVFGYVAELCDDLVGKLDAVQADLFSAFQHSLTHRWFAFEMRLHLADLHHRAAQEAAGEESSSAAILVALIVRIKDLLRQIDQ